MPNLQPLKDLLLQAEQVEIDLVAAERRKTSLEQDCKTLQAKKAFLEGAIADLEVQKTTVKANLDGMLVSHKQEAHKLLADKEVLQDEIDRLTARKQAAQQDHDTAVEQLRLELDKQQITLQSTNNDIADMRHELDGLLLEITTTQARLTEVKQQLADELVSYDRMSSERQDALTAFEGREVQYEERLAGLQKQIDDAEATIDTLAVKRATMASDEAKLNEAKAEFAKKESEAKKILESREQALIEREDKLAAAEQRARRKGILDNL